MKKARESISGLDFHNAVFLPEFPEILISVKILYAIIDGVWLGITKYCIVRYTITSLKVSNSISN